MIYKEVRYISRMAKKKQARKYVTISVLREIMNDLDYFMKNSPYGTIFSSKSDFIHRAIDAKLEQYSDREVRREVLNLQNWYTKNSDKLNKRGIDSWEDLLDRAIDYSERVDKGTKAK